MIRFTGYGVVAEKPRVAYLPRIFTCALYEKLCVASKNDCHLIEWSQRPLSPCKVWGDRTTRVGCKCENVVFVNWKIYFLYEVNYSKYRWNCCALEAL